MTTVLQSIETMRLSPDDAFAERYVMRRSKGGYSIQATVTAWADRSVEEITDDFYYTVARFTPNSSREAENCVSIDAMPFDCDIKDYLGRPKEEVLQTPHELLDSYIEALRKDVQDVFQRVGIPIHRIVCSGYGIQVYCYLHPGDRERVGEIHPLHKRLIERVNRTFGAPLCDVNCSNAKTQLMRVAGSKNYKGPNPRAVYILWAQEGYARLDDFPAADLEAPVRKAPRPVDQKALPNDVLHEIVLALNGEYFEGNRNAIALGMPAWLAKSGVPDAQILTIIERVAQDDEELDNRLDAVERTLDKFHDGLTVSGYYGLINCLGQPTREFIASRLTQHEALARRAAAQTRAFALPAPEFPLHVFPQEARRFIAEAASCTSVPVEMIGGPFLANTGGLIGNRLALRLTPTWRALPGIFLAVVAPPGSAKTPAFIAASDPLRKLQRAAAVRYQEQLAQYEQELAGWRKTGKNEGAPRPTEPRLRDYHTTNITVEGLAPLLQLYPGVVGSYDELSGWVGGLDRYAGGKGSDKPFYLSLWSNTEIKVNRKGSPTIYCPSPVASIVGGIQPDLVKNLHPINGDRDGFVERILPIVAKCTPARWNRGGNGLSLEATRGALELYRKLDHLAFVELDDDDGNAEVTLSPEAEAVWEEWYNENNTELIPEATPLVAGFYSKLQTYVPRFALILHTLHHAPTAHEALNKSFSHVLSAEHMRGAIELGEYFRAHIHRFLELLDERGPAGSGGRNSWSSIERVLQKEGVNSDEGWVMQSQLLHCLGKIINAKSLSVALAEMRDAGIVESRSRPSKTRPGMEWRLVKEPMATTR